MMKRFRILLLCVSTTFLLSLNPNAFGATNTAAQHAFSYKEYEKFHDVLHPLEHDALPKKDFRRIRSQANLLVKRGTAIVKLGVPRGMSDDKKEEFSKELNSFRQALNRFKSDAKSGADSQLITSYSAVHDKFEMLASMLPSKS